MGCSSIPFAELAAEFSATKPPKLLGYNVVVGGKAVAMLTLQELALAGFSPTPDIQSFELAEEVKAGSILFWHPSDGMLQQDPGEDGTPIGVTTKDLAAHNVVRPSFDGFILLDGQFNLTEAELAVLANTQNAVT